MASRALQGDGTLSGIGAATSLLALAALVLYHTGLAVGRPDRCPDRRSRRRRRGMAHRATPSLPDLTRHPGKHRPFPAASKLTVGLALPLPAHRNAIIVGDIGARAEFARLRGTTGPILRPRFARAAGARSSWLDAQDIGAA
jgi:hypothetical protein